MPTTAWVLLTTIDSPSRHHPHCLATDDEVAEILQERYPLGDNPAARATIINRFGTRREHIAPGYRTLSMRVLIAIIVSSVLLLAAAYRSARVRIGVHTIIRWLFHER